MIIATYESKHPELSPNRRWLAQIEKIKGNYYVCFHGATEEECVAKAEAFLRGEKPVKTRDSTPLDAAKDACSTSSRIRPEDEDLL